MKAIQLLIGFLLLAVAAGHATANTNVVIQNTSAKDITVNGSTVKSGGFKVTNFEENGTSVVHPTQEYLLYDTGDYCSKSEADATYAAHPKVFTDTSSGGGDKDYNLNHAWKFTIWNANNRAKVGGSPVATFCMPLDRGNIGCTLARFTNEAGQPNDFRFQDMMASSDCVGEWFNEAKDTLADAMADAFCEVAEEAFNTVEKAACFAVLSGECQAASAEMLAAQGGPEDLVGDIDSALFDGACEATVKRTCDLIEDATELAEALGGAEESCKNVLDYAFLKVLGG